MTANTDNCLYFIMGAVGELVMWKYGPIFSKRAKNLTYHHIVSFLPYEGRRARKISCGWWEPQWGLILGTYVGSWSPPVQHHKFRTQRCHYHLSVRSSRVSGEDAVYSQRQYLPPDRKPILSRWMSHHPYGYQYFSGRGRGEERACLPLRTAAQQRCYGWRSMVKFFNILHAPKCNICKDNTIYISLGLLVMPCWNMYSALFVLFLLFFGASTW